ncbi:MAG TPA: GNAT family N-acetyltransferase [Methanolinea sp.]|nr:GNAT family N-acetyltransferase [Methanolinea sp.]
MLAQGYPTVAARDMEGVSAGFGMLRSYNLLPAFAHTTAITYLFRPEKTGKGLGTRILHCIEEEGKKSGIFVILAHISSLNEGSIRFHQKNGFFEAGRFRAVGKKKGIVFDTVWMEM